MFSRINMLKRAMDASWLTNEAISNNIANANTPGYKRQTVNFQSVLKSHMDTASGSAAGMSRTNPKHMSLAGEVAPAIENDNSGKMRIDGNNVDIEREMSEEAKNTLQYSYLSKQISDEFKRIRLAIRDGR